jgi:diaminopimelate decarboxylase
MENGRFITGPYGWLVSKCHVIKNTYQKYYGLDACMANLMRPGMYGAYHHISILGKDIEWGGEKFENANVVGTLCENNDWFAKDRELPKAEVGDLFVIYDTGAHSHSMGFQYNGKLRAPEVLILGEEVKLIRRRETIEDYLTTVAI